MTLHEQVRFGDGEWDFCDVELVEVMKQIRRLGLFTFSSCQDPEGEAWVYIDFGVKDAVAFYEYLGVEGPHCRGWTEFDCWRKEAIILRGIDGWGLMGIKIRFPVYDLGAVVERLKWK